MGDSVVRSFLVLVLAVFMVTVSSAAAQSPCDPDLVDRDRSDPPKHRHGYSLRGDRCEGLYVQQVAGGSLLTPISFTARFEEFDLGPIRHLILAWPAVGDGRLHVRAQSRRPKLYYRMDTVQAASQRRYEWPTDVLTALGLRRGDLGITAWVLERIGDRERPVHIPLQIGANREAQRSKEYDLIVVPGAELDEVWAILLAVDRQGRPLRQIQRRKLDLGFYPAGRSFSVSIPVPREPGLYRLDVDAALRNGTTTSVNVLFRNPDQQ
jgi:hypothetical protein